MGCNKWIEENRIKSEFLKNRPSFDSMIEYAHRGIRGVVDVSKCGKNCKRQKFNVYVEVQPISEQFYNQNTRKVSANNSQIELIPEENLLVPMLSDFDVKTYFAGNFSVDINTRSKFSIEELTRENEY